MAPESQSTIEESPAVSVPFLRPDVKSVVYPQVAIVDKEESALDLEDKIQKGRTMLQAVGVVNMLSELNNRRFAGGGELVEQAGIIQLGKKSPVSNDTVFDRFGVASLVSLNFYRSHVGSQKLFGSISIGMLENGLWGSMGLPSKGPTLDNPQSMFDFYSLLQVKPSALLGNIPANMDDIHNLRALVDGKYLEGRHAVDAVAVKTLRGVRSFAQTILPEVYSA